MQTNLNLKSRRKPKQIWKLNTLRNLPNSKSLSLNLKLQKKPIRKFRKDRSRRKRKRRSLKHSLLPMLQLVRINCKKRQHSKLKHYVYSKKRLPGMNRIGKRQLLKQKLKGFDNRNRMASRLRMKPKPLLQRQLEK